MTRNIVLRLTLAEIRALAERLDLPLAQDHDNGFSPEMRSAYIEIWRVYNVVRGRRDALK